ncbi:MAG: hypothetical protein H6554_04030 [Chitinophagales bacterium]|nr:hypothetical protein [Chitinophagales bacterium]
MTKVQLFILIRILFAEGAASVDVTFTISIANAPSGCSLTEMLTAATPAPPSVAPIHLCVDDMTSAGLTVDSPVAGSTYLWYSAPRDPMNPFVNYLASGTSYNPTADYSTTGVEQIIYVYQQDAVGCISSAETTSFTLFNCNVVTEVCSCDGSDGMIFDYLSAWHI